MAPKIVQDIELRGQEQVAAGFDQIGKSADQAAASINKIAGEEAAKGLSGLSNAARDAVGGMSGLNDAADQAGRTIGATSQDLVKFGQVLRLLGRAAKLPELSTLGRSIGVVGRIAAAAVPVLLIAGLAKLADHATDAAGKLADLAAQSKVSTDEFQDLAAANAAVGGSAEDTGKMMTSLNEAFREGADRAHKTSETIIRLTDNIAESRDRVEELVRSFAKIKETATETIDRIRERLQKTIESSREEDQPLSKQEKADKRSRDRLQAILKAQQDIEKAKRDEAEARRKVSHEIDLEEKKQAENTRQLRVAREESERNKTALDDLGVKYTDNQGKLVKGKAALLEIADAFSKVEDPAKQQEIEIGLVALGIDRKLIPALRRGREGFEALEKQGKELQTPITKDQIKAADDFQIALGQLGTVVGDIGRQIGLAVSPEFTKWMEEIVKLIKDNKEEIIEFAKQLGSALAPAFKVVGDAIKDAITLIGDFERALKGVKEQIDKLPKLPSWLGGDKAAGAKAPAAQASALEDAFKKLGGTGGAVGAVLNLWRNLRNVGTETDKTKDKVQELQKVAAPEGAKKEPLFEIPDFSKLGQGFAQAIQTNILQPASELGSKLQGIWESIKQSAAEAFDFGMIQLPDFSQLGQNFLQVIQTNILQPAQEMWSKIKGFWDAGIAGVNATWDQIGQGLASAWESIQQTATSGWEQLTQLWDQGVQGLSQAWQGIGETLGQAWEEIVQGFDSFIESLKQKWDDFVQWFNGKIQSAIDMLKKLTGMSAGTGGGGAASAPAGKARGGYIRGPGGSQGDMIPAYLSDKEFVNNAASVRKYGIDFFNALNQMRFPPKFWHSFARGGVASMNGLRVPTMRFARGGLVDAVNNRMRPIHLSIGPDTFENLLAPEDTARRMIKVATARQLSSSGRKPAWYGRQR
jgi:hypothetical protein